MTESTGIHGATHAVDGSPKKRTPVTIKVSIGRPGSSGGAPSKLFRFVFQRRDESGMWVDDPALMKMMTDKYGKVYQEGKPKWVRNFRATLLGGKVDQVVTSKGMLFRGGNLVCSTVGFKYYKAQLEEQFKAPNLTLDELRKRATKEAVFKQALTDIETLASSTNMTMDAIFGSWSAIRVSDDGTRRPFPCTSYDCPWHSGKEAKPRPCAFVGEFYFRLSDVFDDGIALFRTSSMEIIQNFQETLLNAANMTDALVGIEVDVVGSVKRKQFGSDGKLTKVFNVSLALPGKNHADQVLSARKTGELLKAAMGSDYKRYIKGVLDSDIDFDLGASESQVYDEIKNEFTVEDGAAESKRGKQVSDDLAANASGASDEPIVSALPGEEEGEGGENEKELSATALLGLNEADVKTLMGSVKPADFDELISKIYALPDRVKRSIVKRINEETKLTLKLFKTIKDWVDGQSGEKSQKDEESK